MPYGHLTEFSSATKPIIFGIKRTVLVPGVCPCICIRSMMYYVHTGEVMVTSLKIDEVMRRNTYYFHCSFTREECVDLLGI